MEARVLGEVEARTQELGRQLHAEVQSYRPGVKERVQDRLMVLLMEDSSLRTRLLRFIDVLAALSQDRSGRRTAALFREYFRSDFPALPRLVRMALAAARSPVIPTPLLRWLALQMTRVVASRFIVPPGRRALEQTLAHLHERGRYSSFDLLGESVVSEAEAKGYKQGYLDLLDSLGQHPSARSRTPGGAPCLEVSLKISSLTSQFNPADPEGTLRRVRPALEEVCLAASARGIGVTVDAEQYAYRDLAWHIFCAMTATGQPLGQWPDGGIVVQAYLKDAENHARDVLGFARRRGVPMRVRLVKGAYWDYEVILAEQNGWPVPVFQDKATTDQSFERILRTFLEESSSIRLAIGSHNVRAHAYGEALRGALGLPLGALEHQTLFRTSEALSRAVQRMGWPARDYIPVGEPVPGMAYLVRRLLENTSQVGFLTKSRLGRPASELLAPPQPVREDSSYRRPSHPTGFANTPAVRLFDAAERGRFQKALEETRARWGDSHPLRLGQERVESAPRVASGSPSYPASAIPVGWVHRAGLEEVERAIAIANDAFPAWAGRPAQERAEIGLRAAGILNARKDEVAAWVVHEGGRAWPEALSDVEEAIDQIDWNARQLRHLAPIIEAHYRPRGVVACIPPWNFPTALPAGMTSAALMAGNTVILKSADPTPIVAQALVDAFYEAGVPREALMHLPGRGRIIGARLVESPDVDMVAFTGSKDVGISIYRAVSKVVPRKGGIKRALAEMGGKNAIVVFPDADIDEAVQGILHSAFGHAGQKCSACSRLLVHRQIYNRLVDRLVDGARSLPVGPADDPSTVINPVIRQEARDGIVAHRDSAYKEGRVLLDTLDRADRGPLCLGPLIVEVKADKAPTASVAQEEIFGPVLTLIPFESEKEVVDIVNGVVYALTLGIFSRDPGTVARMVRACRAGNIYVNRGITGARVGIEPFGGFQLSGTGPKAGGEEYLLAFLTRRQGFRHAADYRDEAKAKDVTGSLPQGWRTWEETPVDVRLSRLSSAARLLVGEQAILEGAITSWLLMPRREASLEAARALGEVSMLLGASAEVTAPQPGVQIPGQENFLTWSTPRGLGIAAVDQGSDAATLASLIFGPLLAGNGLLVVAPPGPRKVAEVVVRCAWRSGVPRNVLSLASPQVSLERLAAEPVHFAAVDLGLERTRSLYGVLGDTKEAEGQQWLKALISMADGPRPNEPGFLRLFALPKTVAVRTLRHGADLKLV